MHNLETNYNHTHLPRLAISSTFSTKDWSSAADFACALQDRSPSLRPVLLGRLSETFGRHRSKGLEVLSSSWNKILMKYFRYTMSIVSLPLVSCASLRNISATPYAPVFQPAPIGELMNESHGHWHLYVPFRKPPDFWHDSCFENGWNRENHWENIPCNIRKNVWIRTKDVLVAKSNVANIPRTTHLVPLVEYDVLRLPCRCQVKNQRAIRPFFS